MYIMLADRKKKNTATVLYCTHTITAVYIEYKVSHRVFPEYPGRYTIFL